MSKKYFFEEVVAQADDPIYQNQQIVIMSGVGPTKPKTDPQREKTNRKRRSNKTRTTRTTQVGWRMKNGSRPHRRRWRKTWSYTAKY